MVEDIVLVRIRAAAGAGKLSPRLPTGVDSSRLARYAPASRWRAWLFTRGKWETATV
jgi:hypothetical protein